MGRQPAASPAASLVKRRRSAHIAEACGGRASDGVRAILDIVPTGLHDRLPVFIGSAEDVAELEVYGDVQQGAARGVVRGLNSVAGQPRV